MICDGANDGEIALEMVKSDIKKYSILSYDLILMDFNMPVMDGITASKLIREFLHE